MIHIAIDGPSGAGKSTLAKAVAEQLGILYLDTGAMYRALGLAALRACVDPHDEETVRSLLDRVDVAVKYECGRQVTLLGGEDVSDAIRTQEVGQAASDISTLAPVREKMVALQKAVAAERDVVMDGRDIGTHVMPGAKHKFFITATVEVRAKRRQAELAKKGVAADIGAVTAQIRERDHQDMSRAHSPLTKAVDAVTLDTSHMTENEVADAVLARVEGRS